MVFWWCCSGFEGLRLWAHLFEMLAQGDAEATVAVVEHLTGHQCVEDGRAHQRDAEVEAKQPPVLHVFVVLQTKRHNVSHLFPLAVVNGHKRGAEWEGKDHPTRSEISQ